MFNLYAEHVMKNAGVEGIKIKIAGRSNNRFWYADDIRLLSGSLNNGTKV